MLDKLNTYTLQELYKQPIEPILWVVEDLLAPGLYLLGGSPKVGKSWLALQLCLAVCQAELFLGFKTRRTEVLYISLEDGSRRLHIRALHMTEKAPAGLYLCTHAHLIGHGLEQQLDQMLAEHPAVKLVVIDTLQKIREATSASPSYSIDYRDASALKAVADRNDICMVVVHHLRKQKDEDPFKQMSGTNGLNGAADGSIVLDRRKRQEGTATMSATGRDIEDMELTLDFSDCRWSRGCSPEQLQMLQLLPALQRLLADKPFSGTATELTARLGDEGNLWGPAQLSRYLQSHEEELARYGILVSTRRTSKQRLLQLCYRPHDENDGCDASDTGFEIPDVSSKPSQPSSPSLTSQAS